MALAACVTPRGGSGRGHPPDRAVRAGLRSGPRRAAVAGHRQRGAGEGAHSASAGGDSARARGHTSRALGAAISRRAAARLPDATPALSRVPLTLT